MKGDKLGAKQELFCLEYLIDLNATQAAKRAGYSEKTAQRMGSENLSKPLISARIGVLFGERAAKVEVDAEWVLRQAKASFEINSDVFIGDSGLNEMVNAAAAGKFLELCGKHVDVQAFVNNAKVEHTLTDDFSQLMSDASSDE